MTEEIKKSAGWDYDARSNSSLRLFVCVRDVLDQPQRRSHHLVWEVITQLWALTDLPAIFSFIELRWFDYCCGWWAWYPSRYSEKQAVLLNIFTVLGSSAVVDTRFQVVSRGWGRQWINTLSTQLDVYVHKNGKIHYQSRLLVMLSQILWNSWRYG